MIYFNEQNGLFFLQTRQSSYVICREPQGMLIHLYYGAKIAFDDMTALNKSNSLAFDALLPMFDGQGSPNTVPQEYPTFGRGDFRSPAIVAQEENGRRVNELRYVSHRIISGKPHIEGLPQLESTDCETLEITLRDEVTGFEAVLSYSVFEKEDVIARHTTVRNCSNQTLMLHQADSAAIDFEDADFELLTLSGAWARERHIDRRPIAQGITKIGSRRGAIGHQTSPFAALVRKETTESTGEAYGITLVYSADFHICAELNQVNSLRLQAGLNPETFGWELAPNAEFTTPEALLTYSNTGLNGMSNSFHDVCRNYLGKCADRSVRHPIIVNNWEAMYFDLNEEKIVRFIQDAAGLGIDTFVLDDGWFGHRDTDNSSLGDWTVDRKKFPCGMKKIIDVCHENGMNFGIWFEPEMISQDSELYREHPDWCIHAPNRQPLLSRRQLVLDMCRPEVVDGIYEQMAAFLKENDVSYVKWDMNRNITDNGSDSLSARGQREFTHRYILGVYSLMDRLVKNFPNVFFEGCSGGGGRFDFGILYYMPQIWTSDDSDAIERLKIQYGTSLVYPASSMVAHISVCPNHQTGRVTPFKTRGDVAQMFSFGYELDIGKLSEDERAMIREQTAAHRRLEPLVNDGAFYRLRNPFKEDFCAWELVSRDKKHACAMFATVLASPNQKGTYLKFEGLHPEYTYSVEPLGITAHGSTLMNAGVPIKLNGDFSTVLFELKAE